MQFHKPQDTRKEKDRNKGRLYIIILFTATTMMTYFSEKLQVLIMFIPQEVS